MTFSLLKNISKESDPFTLGTQVFILVHMLSNLLIHLTAQSCEGGLCSESFKRSALLKLVPKIK